MHPLHDPVSMQHASHTCVDLSNPSGFWSRSNRGKVACDADRADPDGSALTEHPSAHTAQARGEAHDGEPAAGD